MEIFQRSACSETPTSFVDVAPWKFLFAASGLDVFRSASGQIICTPGDRSVPERSQPIRSGHGSSPKMAAAVCEGAEAVGLSSETMSRYLSDILPASWLDQPIRLIGQGRAQHVFELQRVLKQAVRSLAAAHSVDQIRDSTKADDLAVAVSFALLARGYDRQEPWRQWLSRQLLIKTGWPPPRCVAIAAQAEQRIQAQDTERPIDRLEECHARYQPQMIADWADAWLETFSGQLPDRRLRQILSISLYQTQNNRQRRDADIEAALMPFFEVWQRLIRYLRSFRCFLPDRFQAAESHPLEPIQALVQAVCRDWRALPAEAQRRLYASPAVWR